MANDINALLVTFCDNGEVGIILDAIAGVHELTIHLSGKGGFGKASANIGGNVMNGYGFGKTAMAAIGQGYDGHEKLLLITQR
tara:strand:- start:3910 stop:4158 length:249 start_codon:yes stop_codon:yes gene_type:complete